MGVASPGGAGRNRTLGQDEFEKLKIEDLPEKDEQTKIANCIQAVEDLIMSQTAKVEALKTHKQGLEIQQLFSFSEERA